MITTKHVIFQFFFFCFLTIGNAQNCYIQLEDASGIPGGNVHPDLELVACELQNSFNDPAHGGNFKTFGFGYYLHVDAFNQNEFGYDQLIKKVIDDVNNNSQYYLLISKRTEVNNAYGEYEIELDLPSDGVFSEINLTLLEAIKGIVKSAVEEELERTQNDPNRYREVEIAAMQALIGVILDIEEGNFVLDEELLIASGFILLEEEVEVDRTGNQSLTSPVFDYTGAKLKEDSTSTIFVFLRDEIQYDFIEVFAAAAGFNTLHIISDSENIVSGEFTDAENSYESSTSGIVFWTHLHDSGNGEFKLYTKFKAELSLDDVNKLIDYANYFIPNPSSLNVARPNGINEAQEYNKPKNSCNFENADALELFESFSAKDCLIPELNSDYFLGGVSCGVIDGILADLRFFRFIFEKAGTFIWDVTKSGGTIGLMWKYRKVIWQTALILKDKAVNYLKGFDSETIKAEAKKYAVVAASVYIFWETFNVNVFLENVMIDLLSWFGNFTLQEAVAIAGYGIGIIVYEILKGWLTAGASVAIKGGQYSSRGISFFKNLKPNSISGLIDEAKKWLSKASTSSAFKVRGLKCKILGTGCFVEDTPVLVANKNYHNTSTNPFRNTTKTLALAAAMPIVAVPIQEVQLLDYAVAHETVNAGYGLTASVSDDETFLLDKDPYTNDQQRERDQYELDDENWNEVVFEEVLGGSTAKLALHNEWIDQKGYQVDAVVVMNLPEQGISGPFRITSIKHIIPQKKPVDDDEADDYGYKAVTGLFIHEASKVWKIKFDNGEELGVTHNHPIYSKTKRDWQFAGLLSIGEEVLTRNGGSIVVSKELDRVQEVYNLEIKDYHNFLVNTSGIVVHNTGVCHEALNKLLKPFKNLQINTVGVKNGAVRNGNKVDLTDGRSVPINAKELPDFTNFTAKTSNGTHLQTKIDDLQGNGGGGITKAQARFNDNEKANTWLQNSGLLNDFDSYWINQQFGSPVELTKNGIKTKYTWHHHENGKTMMLVEQNVHNSVTHTGGAAIISSGAPTGLSDFEKLFPDPIFD